LPLPSHSTLRSEACTLITGSVSSVMLNTADVVALLPHHRGGEVTWRAVAPQRSLSLKSLSR
jgi:hypothetical protein